jgi:hypothetical protein
MLPARRDVAEPVEARGKRFASRLGRMPMPRATRETGDERALQQPLCIENRVVRFRAQRPAQGGKLAPRAQAQQATTPPAERHRDNPLDRGMQRRKLRERLVHGPVDLCAGHVPRDVGHRREGVDDVAEGGQPHQQDFCHVGIGSAAVRQRAGRLESLLVNRMNYKRKHSPAGASSDARGGGVA